VTRKEPAGFLEDLQEGLGFFAAALCPQAKPLRRLPEILFDPQTKKIKFPDHRFAIGVALLSRLSTPLEGFLVVLGYSPAMEVQVADVGFCPGVPLLGCFHVPLVCFLVILLYPPTGTV